MPSTRFLPLVFAVIIMHGLAAQPPFADAQSTYVVTTLAPEGRGSLTQAVIDANTDPGPGMITFTVDGLIFPHSTLTVTGALEIDPAGRDIILHGSDARRLFHAIGGDVETILEVRNLSIWNGASDKGGAIRNDGAEVIIEDVLFSGNQATGTGGAIHTEAGATTVLRSKFFANTAVNGGAISAEAGTTTVEESHFQHGRSEARGGAIYSHMETLTVWRSSFEENTSGGSGGAIEISGGVTRILESSFADNSSDSFGGAVQNLTGIVEVQSSTFSGNTSTYGGAISTDLESLALWNSTLSGNEALSGGAVHLRGGFLTVTNSTIVDNEAGEHEGGGVRSSDSPSSRRALIRNTIIAGNTGGDCSGPVTDLGNNIASDGTCIFGAGGGLDDVDPMLGPLADNGGRSYTHAPLAGSPAIDGVVVDPSACFDKDQRGVSRPVGERCDIGAVESNRRPSDAALVVNSLLDADGSCDDLVPGASDCSLREAIGLANTMPGRQSITFDVDGTILTKGLTIGGKLEIDGRGRDVTVSGRRLNQVFNIVGEDFETVAEFTSLTIADGRAEGGGGIRNSGAELIISDVVFRGNLATAGGGAIENIGGMVSVLGSRFWANRAAYGGAVANEGGTVALVSSTFVQNVTTVQGAALHTSAGRTDVINATIFDNRSNFGAAVASLGGATVLKNSIVVSNGAGNCEGAITNGGNNLEDHSTCGWGSANGSMSDTEPLLDVSDLIEELSLGALLPGSPAIDGVLFNAPNDCPPTDVRGMPRPQGEACDIGAYEVAADPGPTAPTPDPTGPTPDPTAPTPDPTAATPDPTEPTPAPTGPTPDPTAPTAPTPDPTEIPGPGPIKIFLPFTRR